MNPNELLVILHTAEKLKNTPRHSWTSAGRRESVAEHSFRLAIMAYFVKDEFPELDMDRAFRCACFTTLEKPLQETSQNPGFIVQWTR